jgi:hypothetical protein
MVPSSDSRNDAVENTTSRASPLTTAMKRCIEERTLRPDVLKRTIFPYYLRTPEDIREALNMATKLDPEYGPLLELVDLNEYETITAGNNDEGDDNDCVEGACRLFWAIHGGCVARAGASETESLHIQQQLPYIFRELYDPSVGVRGTFLACVFRRRTRAPWK